MRRGDERSDYAPLECSDDGVGYVYFLGSQSGERIKIGWSKLIPGRRLKQHAAGDAFGEGGDYEILALVRATRQAEGILHSHFKPFRVAKREVYRADALIPYVTWLRDNYFVSTNREEFETSAGQSVIDPQVWLPGPGRESDRRSDRRLLTVGDPWSIFPSRVTTGDDYYTPPHIVDCVRRSLGGIIDLDPASHVIANQVVKAHRFFTKDQNGLVQPWSGRVFLNPPFSSWPDWVDKVLAEIARGEVAEIVMLGAMRTITAQYFAPLLRRADAMCIISGRNSFWGVLTENDSPTDGHFLLYVGPAVERFTTISREIGTSWGRVTAA